MRNVMRTEPWNVMPRLQDEINRLFGTAQESDSSSATAAWIPLVDIHEFTDRFELYVDLPGVDPNRVELTLDGGVLTLSGDRAEQVAPKPGTEEVEALRLERGHGRFHRRFVLPDTVDSEKVQATGKHGVLTIKIPKQEKTKPRRIQIAG
jgi:HSP20 family protein